MNKYKKYIVMNKARNIGINIFLHKQINCVKVLLFRIILNRDFWGWISYTPHIKCGVSY